MPSRNHFIASLDPQDLAAIAGELETVSLERDQLLTEGGQVMSFVYLPLSSILSVITVMADGGQVESRTIGRESGHGLLHALGSSRSHERMLCQVGGEALRIRLASLAEAARARPTVARAIAAHAQVSHVQSAQSLACNTLHPALERLARWLLMTQDRLGGDVLPLTQEHLAIMLGVQRTTVTGVAQDLQGRGLIAYRRGKIAILDRDGLLDVTCECYAQVEETVAAILADLRSPRSSRRSA